MNYRILKAFVREEVSLIAQCFQFQSILFLQFLVLNDLIFSTNAILVLIGPPAVEVFLGLSH